MDRKVWKHSCQKKLMPDHIFFLKPCRRAGLIVIKLPSNYDLNENFTTYFCRKFNTETFS